MIPFLSSAARTASGTGESPTTAQIQSGRPSGDGYVSGLADLVAVEFELDVTAAATAAADTLDVVIQTRVDNNNWVDVVHFTQVLGNGGTKRYFAKIIATIAETMFENATALAAGSVRNILGYEYLAKWTVVNNTAPSFTFSVHINPIGFPGRT